MKPFVMTQLTRAGALPDGVGVFVQLETSEGPLELRFTFDDAERLSAALQAARPPLPRTEKAVERWDTAIDPINQDAVLRARYADGTSHETRIARSQLPAIAEFLDEAHRRFVGSADMRQ